MRSGDKRWWTKLGRTLAIFAVAALPAPIMAVYNALSDAGNANEEFSVSALTPGDETQSTTTTTITTELATVLALPSIGPNPGSVGTSTLVALPIPTTSTTTTTPPTRELVPVCFGLRDTLLANTAEPITGCRIVSLYGNPLSKGMGILGRLPLETMLADLSARTHQWDQVDPSVRHRCALELIAIFAQAEPGAGNLYRARMTPDVINEVHEWARNAGCLLILDMQVGWSSVADELPYLLPWLAHHDVHLALDPEWDMPRGVRPGDKIGTMDATDINVAIDALKTAVVAGNLPPKMLVVHRFRNFMVTNPGEIRTVPEIRLVVNMDGFGDPAVKYTSYDVAKRGMPTKLTGFKLFTLIDTPMLTPAEVLKLDPVPVFVNYQ